jgi:hypothetical protein
MISTGQPILRRARKKRVSIRTPNLIKNNLQSISISNLFNDFWLPTFFWIDISGIKSLILDVYIPDDKTIHNSKTVVIMVGTRLQLASIVRGRVTQIFIQLETIANSRIGFDIPSAESAPQGDERKLGMNLISIEFDEKKILGVDLFKLQKNNISVATL